MTVPASNTHTPTASWRQKLRDGWDLAVGLDRRLTADDLAAITDRVGDAEKGTSAEIVVAVRSCSGNYRDVDYLVGAVLALLGLVVAIFAPFHVNEHWLPPELAGLFVLGALASAHTPLRRWLTTAARRHRQVAEAAAVAFLDQGVLHTAGRTGVLLFWSLLERRLYVLADVGVHAAVPAGEWNRLLFEAQTAARNAHPVPLLLNTVSHLGAILSTHLPATPSNRDELPNAPRVLS